MDSHHSEIRKQCQTANRDSELAAEGHPDPLPLASLCLLNKYGRGLNRLNQVRVQESECGAESSRNGGNQLSTVEVMKLARERLTYYFSQSSLDLPMLMSHNRGLSYEVGEYVELAQFLIASAWKVANQQFDFARKLLRVFDHSCKIDGYPVERVLYYFSKALRQRIDQDTGKFSLKAQVGDKSKAEEMIEAMITLHPAIIAAQQKLPFSQVTQFAGMQAIVEHLATAKKVHLVDLGVLNGLPCTILMHALADRIECPLELLKITAVGTTSKQKIEETGKRLSTFANMINVPFSFDIVMVPEMTDLKEDMFKLEADEVVAVYSQWQLCTMLAKPGCLEALMGVIKKLHPCVMVVTETEANTKGPDFIDRFFEALLFYSALFDCMEAFMDRCDQHRMTLESYFGLAIQDVTKADGMDSTFTHAKIDYWRDFFRRFGIVETELGSLSLHHADLIIKNFSCGSSCTVKMNQKCLFFEWKGTPLCSVSAWKFHQD
ncbi:hypothetical protein NMG60_11025007 [Bertholletia excelsa]